VSLGCRQEELLRRDLVSGLDHCCFSGSASLWPRPDFNTQNPVAAANQSNGLGFEKTSDHVPKARVVPGRGAKAGSRVLCFWTARLRREPNCAAYVPRKRERPML
jgi:hypothetical protein